MENLKQVDLTAKIETRFCAWHPEEKKLLWFDALWGDNGTGNGWIGMAPYGTMQSGATYRSNVSNYSKDDVIILPYSDYYVVKDGELFLKPEHAVPVLEAHFEILRKVKEVDDAFDNFINGKV